MLQFPAGQVVEFLGERGILKTIKEFSELPDIRLAEENKQLSLAFVSDVARVIFALAETRAM